MTSRLAAIAALTLLLQPSTGSAQELSAKELKRVLRQADKAYAAGQAERAVELYSRILAATPTGDTRRGDALYAVTMTRLSPGPGRDLEAARGHLEELAESFPRHPRRLEISTVWALLSELEAARAEISRRDAEMEAELAAIEAQQREVEALREEVEGESEAAGGRVKSLQAQLRKMRAELSETQAEMAKKDEALQKLRDALVKRGGG